MEARLFLRVPPDTALTSKEQLKDRELSFLCKAPLQQLLRELLFLCKAPLQQLLPGLFLPEIVTKVMLTYLLCTQCSNKFCRCMRLNYLL